MGYPDSCFCELTITELTGYKERKAVRNEEEYGRQNICIDIVGNDASDDAPGHGNGRHVGGR